MIVPWREIDAETLDNLLEEYVSRDGTDYGESEVSVETRVGQMRRRLEKGDAFVWVDEDTGDINILSREQVGQLQS